MEWLWRSVFGVFRVGGILFWARAAWPQPLEGTRLTQVHLAAAIGTGLPKKIFSLEMRPRCLSRLVAPRKEYQPMQYKQAPRILIEIALNPHAGTKLKLRATGSLLRPELLSRLGPYAKRSPEAAAWRIASDGAKDPTERWVALRGLLKIDWAKRKIRRSKTILPGGLRVGGVSPGSRTLRSNQ